MNTAWEKLYDPLKDRFYGALFILTQIAFFGLLIIGVIMVAKGLHVYLIQTLPGFALGAGFWGYRKLRLSRLRRSAPPLPPLSVVEMRAARSKLVKRKTVG